jgi:hypothetical protein
MSSAPGLVGARSTHVVLVSLRVAAGDEGLLVEGGTAFGRYRVEVGTDERGEPVASAVLACGGAAWRSGAVTLGLGENELVLQVGVDAAAWPGLLLSDGVAVAGPEPGVLLYGLPAAPPPFSGVLHHVRHLPPLPSEGRSR